MSVVRGALAACALLVATSCGSGESGDDSGLRVTVVKGVAKQGEGLTTELEPGAGYVDGQVVFVSGAQFSSTCPPKGSAKQDGRIITLTIDDSHEGACTADAGVDTFLIDGATGTPKHLVVLQKGQPDQRLDLLAG
jgi:hypothetical protein